MMPLKLRILVKWHNVSEWFTIKSINLLNQWHWFAIPPQICSNLSVHASHVGHFRTGLFNSSPQIMTVLTNKISAFREKKKQLYPFTCKFEIIMYSDPCVHKDHNHMTLTSQATESRFDSPPEMPFFMSALPICVSAHLLRPICTSKCFHYQTIFFSTVQFILATRQIFFSGLALFSKQAVTTSFGFAFLMVSDFEIQIKYKEN